MANLYEINQEIMNCVDEETGEIIDIEMLNDLQMQFDEKVENIACFIKNLLADAKAIKEEEGNLALRRRSCENKAASLKKYLSDALNGQKFKTAKVSISYRKSESVDIENMKDVPEEYLKVVEPTVDKTYAKKIMKSGIEIPGLRLAERKNIQIR